MKNRLINGDFQIWQRGTDFHPTAHLLYAADRWNIDWPYEPQVSFGKARISRQPFPPGQTEVPGGPKYFLGWEQQTASSAAYFRDLSQQIEDVCTFSGQQVTLSCYLRQGTRPDGAEFPVKADRPVTVRLVTEQFFGGGASPSEFTESELFEVTTSWRRYSYSPVLKSVAGKVISPNGDDSLNFIVSQKERSANEPLTLDVADCQIELGPAAAAFERRSFSQQLADAERYFQKSYSYDTAPGAPNAWASSVNCRQVSIYNVTGIQFRRGMRRPPRITLFNPATAAVGSWRSLSIDVKVSAGDIGTNYFHVDASNGINGEPLVGHWIAEAEYSDAKWWG